MRYLRGGLIATILLVLACSSVEARIRRQPTIRELFADADAIVIGRLENARKVDDGGETDVVILDIVKSHPKIQDLKKFIHPRFVAEPNPKQSFLMTLDFLNGTPFVYGGIPANPTLIEHAKRIVKLHGKKPEEILRFYFDYLHDADEAIRKDALLEFGIAPESVVGKVARMLPAEKLRTWLRDPKATAAYGQYAHLLSYCGEPNDADELYEFLEKNAEKLKASGVLRDLFLAPLCLKPETYGSKYRDLLRNKKAPFLDRYLALNAVRHVHEERPELHKQVNTVAIVAGILDVTDMADFAIEDLRKWKRWELTDVGSPGTELEFAL